MTGLPLQARILLMVGMFEGSKNGTINVWDEQFLSVGTLQYAVKGGSGVRFLARIRQIDPEGFMHCLGTDFTRATVAGPEALREYCRTQVWKQLDRWQPAFRNLAQLPAYAQADSECAKWYLDSGMQIAEHYGLTSERGLAFAVDRVVQQGGKTRSEVELAVKKLGKGTPEWQVMKVLALAYAATALPQYAGVVRARALTVATGSSKGTGYPGKVDLELDYGLSPTVAWE